MSTHGAGAKVKLRLYLEGRLVPNALIAIDTQAQVGQPAMANLTLTPTNAIKHILPFTWVHVFTTDPWDPDPKGDLSDYNLLFEGLVISRGFTRTDNGRNFVVQCADPSILWTKAKQFWINLGSIGGSIVDQLAVQTSGGYGRFGTVTATGSYGYLVSKSMSLAEVPERFMDTLISVLDDIGNVNPFYANARNRFRITDRIIRTMTGNAEKLFQINLMTEVLQGLAGRISQQTDLLEVVNQVLSAIMHEWSPILAPPYIESRIFGRDPFGNVKRKRTKTVREDQRGKIKSDQYSFEYTVDNIVASTMFKPHCYTLSPPTCNVLYPNMYEQQAYQENFLAEPTRVSMQPQLFFGAGNLTSGLLFTRPTELEVFLGLVRDPSTQKLVSRTPDATYGPIASQVPLFSDYDWSTNEERFRGINFDFLNLSPAPSTLALSDQGAKQADGTRKGGMPKYLQNVASYEYFKSKFASRTTALHGPLNIRPVVGFPILALDDSAAGMTMMAYLRGISHQITAEGVARTTYNVEMPRLIDEVDLNRPKFENVFDPDGALSLKLSRVLDENGVTNFDFKQLFDGLNRPPIPEWFSDDWKLPTGIDNLYRKWFGENCRAIEAILFEDPEAAAKDFREKNAAGMGYGLIEAGAAGAAAATLKGNDLIDQAEAARAFVADYKNARDQSREFYLASTKTQRATTKIDEAFRFIGAGPVEIGKTGPDGRVTFDGNPARSRTIKYGEVQLSWFIGDTSPGSGYDGTVDGESPRSGQPTKTNADGSVVEVDGPPAQNEQMSGAFPLFDTRVHSGKDLTDAATRAATIEAESQPTSFARYDGRPVMYDFEFRLWVESLRAAGYKVTGEKIEAAADVGLYFIKDDKTYRPATPAEAAAAAQKRQDQLAAEAEKEKARRDKGIKSPKQTRSHSAAQQAPTGDAAEGQDRLPLPQPLSEKQVIELRRSVIEAYINELEQSRGFTG